VNTIHSIRSNSALLPSEPLLEGLAVVPDPSLGLGSLSVSFSRMKSIRLPKPTTSKSASSDVLEVVVHNGLEKDSKEPEKPPRKSMTEIQLAVDRTTALFSRPSHPLQDRSTSCSGLNTFDNKRNSLDQRGGGSGNTSRRGSFNGMKFSSLMEQLAKHDNPLMLLYRTFREILPDSSRVKLLSAASKDMSLSSKERLQSALAEFVSPVLSDLNQLREDIQRADAQARAYQDIQHKRSQRISTGMTWNVEDVQRSNVKLMRLGIRIFVVWVY
jgi:hypothetical protein